MHLADTSIQSNLKKWTKQFIKDLQKQFVKEIEASISIATACTYSETRCWDLLTWAKNKLYSNILVTNQTTFTMV